jgi:cystathionine beta-lyase/cystathionine gamma-synthase
MAGMSDRYGPSTQAIHAGEGRDPVTGAHATPIYQTAAFSFETAEAKADTMDRALAWQGGYFYSRTGNPTTSALERKLAVLEGADEAVVGASGMASVSAALLISLAAGDHLLVSEDLFVISKVLVHEDLPRRGIEVTAVDTTDPRLVAPAIRPNTRALLTETVSNPHMLVADVPALAAVCRPAGVRLIVDNTFLGPMLMRPLALGADLVLHSATKYLAGHGDTLAGVLAGPRALVDRARAQHDALGSCAAPFNAWLVLRGVRTLPLRTAAHCRNAAALAALLAIHPAVAEVRYPGLPSHPQHDVAVRLLAAGFGGMLAFRVKGGRDEMNRFANALELCDLSVSLGDVFTLVYPMPRRDNLIRVSVGCEDTADILADFSRALDRSAARTA